jgi:penicillin-binding protein 1A
VNERFQRILASTLIALRGVTAWLLGRPWAWAALLFVFASGVGLSAGAWRNLCSDCPSIAQIHTWEPQETSKVFSHDGRQIAELGIERRTAVTIDALPPYLPQAFIAIEDGRFYDHGGFDARAIFRAVIARVVPTGLIRSLTGFSLRTGGASTITQQLARNIFVEEIGFDVSLLRKLKELQVALEIERAYTKDQILEAYMNQIYLGPGPLHGVQAASRYYFGIDAIDLDAPEAALLAAIANNPGVYSPFSHPNEAMARRNLVLDRMEGERFLTESEAEVFQATPLSTDRSYASEGSAPFFVEYVRQEMQDLFGNELYTGGYRIFTTLDVEMQRAAELALERALTAVEARPGYPRVRYAEYLEAVPDRQNLASAPFLQGAMVAIEPQTGAIRAYVGGRDF